MTGRGTVNDKDVVRAASCIWGEITDDFWSNATPEQQRRYIGIARAALIVAGVEGPYLLISPTIKEQQ